MRIKKPEPPNVRGVCCKCNKNLQSNKGNGIYRALCQSCHNKRYGMSSDKKYKRYGKYKKNECELCGFKPIHKCQLDVDHIDGNHDNNEYSNLQTLCANCHRLKTYLNKDWENKYL